MILSEITFKQHKIDGKRSPHKVLLFIIALDAYMNGKERYLDFETYLYPKLYNLLLEIGISKPKPEYPFWRMQNDGFWDVIYKGDINANKSGDVTKAALIARDAKGGFCKDLFSQAKAMTDVEYEKVINYLISHHLDLSNSEIVKIRNYFNIFTQIRKKAS